MFEPRLISPMLDDFMMGAPISEHHGIRCCPAMPKGTDKRCIVKIISIPAAQTQLDALLLTGAYPDEASALQYFASVAEDIKAESEVLSKLSKNEGFIPFEGCQIVPMENGVGYDVYLLSPYKRSLSRFFQKETMTHLKAVNLGLDMCAALALCRQAGYLYVDLKPENIFVDSDGEYRIGDLGFVKLDSLKYASLPDKYRSAYTAPEVQDVYASLNDSIDIYAAGLVLYQAYNGGNLPFSGSAPAEALPAPIFADYEMAEIILKACDPDPACRWANPVQMGQALISYMQRNGANDTPIVPAPAAVNEPLFSEAGEAPAEESPAAEAEDISLDAILAEAAEEASEETASEGSESEEDAAADLPEVPAEEIPEPAEVCEEVSEETAPTADEASAAEDENGQIYMAGFADTADEENSKEANALPLPDLSAHEEAETQDAAAEAPQEDHFAFVESLISEDALPAEEIAQDTTYDEISPDTTEMLSQADELIALETPAPVVVPEAVEIPIPAPLAEAGEIENRIEEHAAEEAAAETEQEAAEDAAEEAPAAQDDAAAEVVFPVDDYESDYEDVQSASFSPKKLIAIIVALVLLVGLVFGGYWFYKEYYLQSVTDLTLDGNEDMLTVHVKTAVDESLLSVVCVDTYGTKQVQSVENGVAVFTGLNPSTLYSIKVEISGMHKLHGDISDSYSTPMQSTIVSLNAVTGNESGSAIISFTVDGSDSGNWLLTYSADGEEEKTHSFSGHMATVTGLTQGKEYAFVLTSTDGAFLTGETEIRYVATDPVFAENVHVTGASSESITVRWDAPEDAPVENWIVHCYNNGDFNETVTVSSTTAEFDGMDFSKAYTIEVTAVGMSAGTRFYMSENTVFVTNESASVTATDTITVQWDCASAVSGQWIVQYSIEGLEDWQDQIVRTQSTSAAIRPFIPNATYNIEIKLDNGSTVLAQKLSVTTPEAAPFQGHILGYLVRNTPIQFSMCKRPALDDWSYSNVSAYTTLFSPEEQIGFVGYIPGKYNQQTNAISIMYIYRDASGAIVKCESTSAVWRNMWYQRYCELNAPNAPQDPGTYTVEIYFDGYIVHTQNFTVQ